MRPTIRKTFLAAPLIAILFTLLAGYTYVSQAAGPAEVPEIESIKTIEEIICAAAVDPSERGIRPGVVCAAGDCTGGMQQFVLKKPVLKHFRVSKADCIKKLDSAMDNVCVRNNAPGNCTGNCPVQGENCKNAGFATGITSQKIPNTNIWTCASSTGMCACKCR